MGHLQYFWHACYIGVTILNSNEIIYYASLVFAVVIITTCAFRSLRLEFLRFGALAFFSPALGFYLLYLTAFILRPIAMSSGLLTSYTNDSFDPQLWLEVTWVSLFGSVLFYYSYTPINFSYKSLGNCRGVGEGRIRPAVIYSLSIVCSFAFLYLLSLDGALTLDLGVNRAIFSANTVGRGYVFLINAAAAILILMALRLDGARWHSHLTLRFASVGIFMFANIMVTNRFLITSMLAGFFSCWLINLRRSGKKVSILSISLLIGIIAIIGSILGYLRGLGEYKFDEINGANPVAYFLWTFDMGELLGRTLDGVNEFDYGKIWIEDLLYLSIPRSLWEGKPQIYGAVRAQEIVLPEMIPLDGVPIATYPIGVFGEGYLVFGIFGVAISLVILGVILRKIFISGFDRTASNSAKSIVLFSVYILQCVNPLGYYRSFGWFASLLILQILLACMLYALSVFISYLISTKLVPDSKI